MEIFGFHSGKKQPEKPTIGVDPTSSLLLAAKKGDADAAIALYKMHKSGKEDFFWAHYAAELGNPLGAYFVGKSYETALSVCGNLELAFAYYEWAARRNLDSAKEGVERVLQILHLQEADAEGLDFGQMHEIAMQYLEGEEEQNLIAAVFWLKKAASLGNLYSKFMLGAMYEKGLGVLIDLEEALKYYLECENYELEDIDERIALVREKLGRSASDYEDTYRRLVAFMDPVSGGEHMVAAQQLILGSRLGSNTCAQCLAKAYKEADGIERNFDEALYYAGKCIFLEEDIRDSYLLICQMLAYGYGTDKNPMLASDFYGRLKNSLRDNPEDPVHKYQNIEEYDRARLTIGDRIFLKGTYLISGEIGEIDVQAGLEYEEQGRAEGDVYASKKLARLYTSDIEVEMDLVRAMECLSEVKQRNIRLYPCARNGMLLRLYNMHHYGAFESLNKNQIRREAKEAMDGQMDEYAALLYEYGREYLGMQEEHEEAGTTYQEEKLHSPIVRDESEQQWEEMDMLLLWQRQGRYEDLLNYALEHEKATNPGEIGFDDDSRLAVTAHKLAIEGGTIDSAINLFQCYLAGYGVPQYCISARSIAENILQPGVKKYGMTYDDSDVYRMQAHFENISFEDAEELAEIYRKLAKALDEKHHKAERWLVYEYYATAQYFYALMGKEFSVPDVYLDDRIDWESFAQNDWFMLQNEYMGEDAPAENEIELVQLKERKDVGLPDNLDTYFEGMIGMESVKEQLNKIYQSVKMQILRNQILVERGLEPIADEKGYNFILLGNPGTGKTTVARIIAQILYDIKVRTSNSFMEVERSRMISDHIGGTEERMRSILDGIDGGTLFIDEAYALYREDSENDFGQEAIDVLMKDMEDHRNSYSVIMAGYREPMMNMIRNSNSGFSSRFAYTLDLPDYSEDALIEMAHVHMEKNGMVAMEGVDNAIRKCIGHDKIDDTFGNARYIRELVNRAIENQAKRLSEEGMEDQEDLFRLMPQDFWQGELEEVGLSTYLDELNGLIGLSSVKEEVQSLINQIMVQEEMERRGLRMAGNLGTLHMAFKGNPGTGKTTVARIIGKLYNQLGVLKRPDVFVECSRADLVGAHVGETALKVRKAVQSAMGGILFIDEAYSLVQNENDSFGLEAVNELVSLIENNRENLLVIIAGYSRDIDVFLKNNPGLRSRIPKELVFEDYNLNELYEIAVGMLSQKGLILSENAGEALRSSLVMASMQEDFGNARGVRNLIDTVTRKQNVRIAQLLQQNASNVTDEQLMQVLEEDFVHFMPYKD